MTLPVGFDVPDELYDQAIGYLEDTVHDLAKRVPSPRLVQVVDLRVFRYTERTAEQAIVQKLARHVSALGAARLLLHHGFAQEVGMLQRVLDETEQDVFFLTSGLGGPTKLHREFLDAFYEEEFDADTALASTQKRKMVPRRKIRAYIARHVSGVPGSNVNPSFATEVYRTSDRFHSGYVHGASPHLMAMFGGDPPRFHMNGMSGMPDERSHRQIFSHYVLRSILMFSMVAYAFGDRAGGAKIRGYADQFDKWVGASNRQTI